MKFPYSFIIAAFMVSSCTEAPTEISSEGWPVDFEALVDLHCQARELKKQRFDLADSIRTYTEIKLAEEGMSEAILAEDSKLMNWDRQKEVLVSQSEAIADSIKVNLQQVIVQLDTEQKRLLNDSLKKTVIRNGCE